MNTSRIIMSIFVAEFFVGCVVSLFIKDYRMALYYGSAALLNLSVVL